jgi:hypothetical protein
MYTAQARTNAKSTPRTQSRLARLAALDEPVNGPEYRAVREENMRRATGGPLGWPLEIEGGIGNEHF